MDVYTNTFAISRNRYRHGNLGQNPLHKPTHTNPITQLQKQYIVFFVIILIKTHLSTKLQTNLKNDHRKYDDNQYTPSGESGSGYIIEEESA